MSNNQKIIITFVIAGKHPAEWPSKKGDQERFLDTLNKLKDKGTVIGWEIQD